MTAVSYSQNPDSTKAATISFFKDAFSIVPTGQFSNLVPFAGNGKWGYLDRITKKIMVKPVMQNPEFFNPDIKVFYNREFVDISGDGKISIEQPSENAYQSYDVGPDMDDKVRSSVTALKGLLPQVLEN